MTYFQNPFPSEFRGNWVLGDRQHSLTFVCPGNSGRSYEVIYSWNESTTYNLSGNDSDNNPKNILLIKMHINGIWNNLQINLTDNSIASLTPAPNDEEMKSYEIISILNSNSSFSSYFNAYLEKNKIAIKQKFPTSRMKFFVINGQAEEVLKFNKRAGVAELPSYFKKYKIGEKESDYLVELNPSQSGGLSVVDDNVINNSVDNKGISLGLNSSLMKKDYEFLEGRSGLFIFKKISLDENGRTTQVIEYSAGAVEGDFAKKINYTYSGSNTNPSSITEIPYVLQNDDLLSVS
jgi:hypothetical protein